MSDFLTEEGWQTLEALAEGLIGPVSAQDVQRVNPELSIEDCQKMAQIRPKGDNFRKCLYDIISRAPEEKVKQFKIVVFVLSHRSLAVALTHTYKLITEMSLPEREALLLGWQNSFLTPLRALHRSLCDSLSIAFVYKDPAFLETLGYLQPDPTRGRFEDGIWEVPISEPKFQGSNSQLDTDVVIVGSGCSSGVAAYDLVKAGFKVLILEKGRHVRPSDLGQGDLEVDDAVYEHNNRLQTSDGSLNIMAGSTVGGGGAVNWSCSLRTPQDIRQEWVDLGVPFYGTTVYDDAEDFVEQVMGVTDELVEPHSFSNRTILEGSKKLGYPAKATGQNTGKHPANVRYQGFGHRYGEKGGVCNWLHYALSNGAQLLDNAEVVKIRHSRSKATGVDVLLNGKTKLVVNARKVVVACGSLQTPTLLLRSGFKNKQIGKGLKLHPVTVTYGMFDEIVNKMEDPIMTSVCTKADNRDGKMHGVKIEVILNQPSVVNKFYPWRNGIEHSKNILSYKHVTPILILARDKDSGTVRLSKNPFVPRVDYFTSKFDLESLKQGSLTAANILYIQGAKRIILSHPDIPDFVSNRPKESRRLFDADYQNWYNTASSVDFELFKTSLGCAHQMSSCRISNLGPSVAPCDDRGRLYECKNVHVIDASVFPTASGVNPMISCMATAHVLTSFLMEDLHKSAGEAHL